MLNFEQELSQIVLARLNEQQAISILTAAGYKVSKPRKAKAEAPKLNAVGKPYSPSYDPAYRMKYKAGSTAHLFKPYPANMPWVRA